PAGAMRPNHIEVSKSGMRVSRAISRNRTQFLAHVHRLESTDEIAASDRFRLHPVASERVLRYLIGTESAGKSGNAKPILHLSTANANCPDRKVLRFRPNRRGGAGGLLRHQDGRALPAGLGHWPQDVVLGLHRPKRRQARADRLGPLPGRVVGGGPWEGARSARSRRSRP